jgi:hypothetical protein
MTSIKIRTAFAALTGVGILLGGAGSSEAALVQTFSVDQLGGQTSQSLFFDAATPNQDGHGTLAQVTIEFSTLTVGGGDQVTVTGGEGGSASRGGISSDLQIIDLSGSLFSGTTTVAASTCSAVGPAGCTGPTMTPTQPTFSPGTPVVLTDGGALADFIGGPVQLTAAISTYDVTPSTCVPNSISITCGGFDNITWAPTVTVSYTYNTVDTPEPATIGILGSAGAALGLLRRRKPNGSLAA